MGRILYCEKFELFMQSVVSDLPLLLRCISPENKQLVISAASLILFNEKGIPLEIRKGHLHIARKE